MDNASGVVTSTLESAAVHAGDGGETAADAIRAIRSASPLWFGKSLVSLRDVSRCQIEAVLNAASALKDLKRNRGFVAFSRPTTMALVFEKPSLRTRVSFEAGMAELGGHGIYLAPTDVGLGKREPVEDVAAGLSRLVDIIAARVFEHDTVAKLAHHATIPVINALSDHEHPIQAFADMLTIRERLGRVDNTVKLAYVGDGNNVLHALLLACSKLGVHLSAACPAGYFPSEEYVNEARSIAESEGNRGSISIVSDPIEAVRDANALYTDVWASMGQESEHAERASLFADYQINSALMAHAKPDTIVLHCLPAHRGEEISSDVMAAHHSVIFDQAENRLHTQKALVALMLGL